MTDEYESPLHAVARTARLVTSLTVTKRDARGFAEECGAERLLTSYWAGSGPPPLPPSFLIGIDHRALTPHTRVVVYVFVVTTNRLINSLPFPAKRDLRLILLLPRKLFRSRSSPAAAASRLYVILRDSTRHCAFYLLYPRPLSLSLYRENLLFFIFIHSSARFKIIRTKSNSIDKKEKERKNSS